MTADHCNFPMDFLQAVFISPNESRPRAGWRLLAQSALLLALTGCLSLPVLLIPEVNEIWDVLLFLLLTVEFITVTLSVYLARRFLDRRSFASLGLDLSRRTILDILVGLGISFVMMGLVYLIQWRFGWLTFLSFAWQVEPGGVVLQKMLMITLTFVLVAWSEELLSRGYHLQNLAESLNTFWAVTLSGIVFSILHLLNPNASWQGAVGIFLAGILLAYGYLRTRQLWLSIGLHFGWNFFEGVVFGFPVSGLEIYRLTRIAVHGPPLWTGGDFGPEAGLVLIPALLLGSLLIHFCTRHRQGDEDNTEEGTELI